MTTVRESKISRYDQYGNEIYFEDASGYWWKCEYEDGKQVYFKDSEGFWWRCDYRGDRVVYYVDSEGCIEDNR